MLNALDRFSFGQWLRDTAHSVHRLGASIGAWRMAVAGRADAGAAFLQLAEDYIAQDNPTKPASRRRRPT